MGKTRTMHIAVVGVGAVGGYFGGALARAGYPVTFVARGATATALREHGVRIDSDEGGYVIARPSVATSPDGARPCDLVILGVKAWQVADLAPTLAPLLADENAAVLPLQNGVEAPDQVAEALGARHALGGLCKIFCYQVGPGHIRHAGISPWVGIGELDNRRSERAEAVVAAFGAAGIDAEICHDIHAALWEKSLFVTTLGSLGAAQGEPVGVVRAGPVSRGRLVAAMRELEGVARSRGIDLAGDVVDTTMAFIDNLPEEAVASMARDIAEGRPSELEAQLGVVVRLAEQAGLEVPVSRELYELLAPLEARARGTTAG